jgi:Na+/proline symporter
MTAAFFVFGVAMLLFAPVLAERFHHSKLIRCAVTLAGVATLGVAAFPLNRSGVGLEDVLHGTWAVSGYVGTALAPIAAAAILWKGGKRSGAVVSLVVGLISASALIATSTTSHPGLDQRIGLSVVDVWFVVCAVLILWHPGARVTTPAPGPVT